MAKRPPFIPIARKAFSPIEKDGDVFWNEPRVFSRWEAWQFLIVHAARKSVKRIIPRPGKTPVVVEMHRGEFYGSLRWFGRRWKWSEKKVRTWFSQLEKQHRRIRTQRETQVGTVYLLTKYWEYNGDAAPVDAPTAAPETQQGRSRDAAETQGSRRDVRRDKEGIENKDVVGDSASLDDVENWVSLVIRTANKGMIESGIEFQPILASHASRQSVFDWIGEGVDRALIESTVFDVAKVAKKQISSMNYFGKAVRAAHEKAKSARVGIPEGSEAHTVKQKGVAANYPKSDAPRTGDPLVAKEREEQKRVEEWRKENQSEAAAIWEACVQEVKSKPGVDALGARIVQGYINSKFRQRVIAEHLTPKLAAS
jgi:hypothetical protein